MGCGSGGEDMGTVGRPAQIEGAGGFEIDGIEFALADLGGELLAAFGLEEHGHDRADELLGDELAGDDIVGIRPAVGEADEIGGDDEGARDSPRRSWRGRP